MPTDDGKSPSAFVFNTANFERLKTWLTDNWFIAVAAVSLALAGIFLVQYGIENGVLSPRNRVLSGLGFGAALIGAGEYIRRRIGDGPEGGAAAFVPSTFAGAGVVTLFAAVFSAQQLYGLIGQEVAFAGLVALAVLALVLGWLYGPFLSVIGISGAVLTPFIVSTGMSENIQWLFYYFALIAAIGLGVDAMKRSAWVSTVALVLPYIGAALIWLASGSEHFTAFAAIVAALAVCVPTVQLRPAFSGSMTVEALNPIGRERHWPEFPTRLAAAGLLALAGVAPFVSIGGGEAAFWLGLAALFAALAVLAFWLDRTPVLDDLAVPVALALLAMIGAQGYFDLSVASALVPPPQPVEPVPGVSPAVPTRVVTWLVGFGCAVSGLAGLRSIRNPAHSLYWAAGAAVFAPATMVLLALYWNPLLHMSDVQLAAHAVAVAVLMTLFAEHALRRDGEARLRASLYALAALNMLALSLTIVLTETALTFAIALMAVSAAWLDRKFDVRPVTLFVQVAIIACGYRLLVDPGLFWALDTSLIELCVGFGSVIGALGGVWVLLQRRQRTMAIVVAESAAFSLTGAFLCLLLYRVLDHGSTYAFLEHWALALFGMIWMLSAAAQAWRASAGGALRWVRWGLGGIFGCLGLMLISFAATVVNPLYSDVVIGPPVLDSLLVAYGLPALLLGAVAWKFGFLPRLLRFGLGAGAVALAALYIGLEIRRLWQGPVLSGPDVMQGELYSYTIAMLLTGSALLVLALWRRSSVLQRAGVAVIALTIAKVFLIDMSGLEGLTRALSFLALGLILAGLAVLNRWITRAVAAE